MRSSLAAFFVLMSILSFCSMTGIADAALVAAVNGQKVCQSSWTGDPSGAKTFTSGPSAAAEMKAYLQRVVMCPNACYDVSLELSFTVIPPALKIITTANNRCKGSNSTDPAKDNRGCGPGQTQPTVYAASPSIPGYLDQERTVGPKSRCDSSLSNTIGTFASGNLSGGFDQMASLSDPTTIDLSAKTQSQASQQLQAGLQGDKTASAAVLQSFGLSADQAQAAVQNKPEDVNKLLSCMAQPGSCDSQTFQQTASAVGVNMNLDVAKQAMANPGQFINAPGTPDNSSGSGQQTQSGPPSGGTTFDTSNNTAALPTQCGISGIAGNFNYAESVCGAKTYQPLTSVQGPYQYLCSTWQHDTAAAGMSQYSDCSYRNDTAVSTQLVNAMYDTGGVYQQAYGAQCSSAGLTWSSCAYAIHVFGQGGFQNLVAAESANPGASAYSLCGTAVSSAACSNNLSIFRNGGTVAGVFSELDRRLGSSSAIIPAYAPSSASPYGSIFTPGPTGYYTPYGGSPFMNAIPVGYSYSVTPASQNYTPMQATPTMVQPTPVVVTPVVQQGSPVASIIVQPTSTSPGQPLTVSWSSVGMNTASPCILQMGSTTIAQTNEGSQRIQTPADAAGTLTFTLQCQSTAGASVSQSTSVTVTR